MIAGRLPVRATPEQATWHYCEDHAALVGLSGICPGPAFDLALAERSVTVQAARAFGDWPATARDSSLLDWGAALAAGDWSALAATDPLWARYLDGDR